ncbi:hypothetical protein BDZ89DRAFT_1074039 [Hymenopellis radicata]|nr:hypothetical protein BDZ89DRAFT_1074039 [Hymenopellis radicata]
MFRATSRPLFRISRAPSARCASKWSAPRIPAPTRSYITPPQPSFASTVGKRGWWQWAWFREDGTPRSKRTGAFYALIALQPCFVLKHALDLYEENASTAWLLAQCYRTDARYDKINWDDLDSVVDYFRDLVIVLMVHHYKIPRDRVDDVFDHAKQWDKQYPAPISESSPESLALFTKRVFTRAAHDVHFILHFRSGKTNRNVGVELIDIIDSYRPTRATVGTLGTLEDLGLVETGFWVVRILRTANAEWLDRVASTMKLRRQVETLERLKAADHVADWETVDK